MRSIRLPLLLAPVLLAGCAATPGADRLAQRDPLEKVNRGVWGFNQAVDKVLLKPVTVAYRAVLPRPVRSGVTHFFSNVSEPFSAVNNLLQGKPKRAGRNLARFVVNTTIGVGGLGDPASKMKIRPAPEDFGQTLARWGVNAGPYLVLPVLGPSTLRDGVGTAVAFEADPYRICVRGCGLPNGVPTGLTVVNVVDTRSQLIDAGADAFLATSADPYATARSAYLQRRRAAIVDQDDVALSTPGAAAPTSSDDLDAAVRDLGGATSANPPLPGAGQPATPAPAGSSADDAELNAAVGDIDQANSETGATTDPATAPAQN